MKDSFKNFWWHLLDRLRDKIDRYLNKDAPKSGEMPADETRQINFFLMVLKCVLNRVLTDCSFDVGSDSAQAEPLRKAVRDLQDNAYTIGGYMLGGSHMPDNRSECWAVLTDKETGAHHFMSGDEICITAMRGNRITDCYMIWNVVQRADRTYYLCRQHTLDEAGTLRIRFFIADSTAKEITADIPEWDSFLNVLDSNGAKQRREVVIPNANHIGFGRYKSPVLCLTNRTYGKPLNFGCGEIERKIQRTLDMIRLEYKATRTKLFADDSIVRDTDENGNSLDACAFDEYLFKVRAKSSESVKGLLESFSPAIRSSAYFDLLTRQLEEYQALMGVQELITHERTTAGATATEVKALNTNNIAMENAVRKAFGVGNADTLSADSLYYGIRTDLWSYDETWKDIYEDEQQTLNNWLALYNAGVCPLEDVVRYWYPTLDDAQIQEKTAALKAEKESSTQNSLDAMLNQ